MFSIFGKKSHTDWILLVSAMLITLAGAVTMYSFRDSGTAAWYDGGIFFNRQLLYLAVSFIVAIVFASIDFRFMRNTSVVVSLFTGSLFFLGLLFVLGHVAKGAQSWFRIGGFSFQPVDLAKIALIILLAKYFSRRHIEIRNIRHIIVSGVYASAVFFLVLLQPDFGSAVIIFLVWFGMVLVSGISYKHILLVVSIGVISSLVLWGFVFKDYQKARIRTFVNPLTDIRGAGYNAYQSMIAVGSGQMLGKGIGYGTQSRLRFLPEYQTDFIFAAFAEEWGFIGAFILLGLYATLLWRIFHHSIRGESNFEILFGFGIGILFLVLASVNVGMNIGVLPVTGVPLPFMSYGGSHLLTEYIALGLLMGMSSYARPTHRSVLKREIESVTPTNITK